jgi:DNA-binding NarL/FixJ family response regulator
LAILDMIMGAGIDGAETYRLMKEIHPSQKALTISGYRDSDRVEAVQKLGSGEHLTKPVTYEGMAQAVRAELDRGQNGEERHFSEVPEEVLPEGQESEALPSDEEPTGLPD